MITVFMGFFLTCGLFQIASAIALELGMRVPGFMRHRSAFGQLCQGTFGLLMAELCATSVATPVTWVLAGLAPILLTFGLYRDQVTRKAARVKPV